MSKFVCLMCDRITDMPHREVVDCNDDGIERTIRKVQPTCPKCFSQCRPIKESEIESFERMRTAAQGIWVMLCLGAAAYLIHFIWS